MTSRLWLPRGLFLFATSVLFLATPNLALASSRSCSYLLDPIQAVTLKSLREKNTAHLQQVIKQHPMPGFDYIENEVKNEQVGEIGPRALQQMLGAGVSFISTPAPSAAMDTAVNMHEEGRSFPVHVDVEWFGKRTSTAVYASLPKTLKPVEGNFLVGSNYPVVQVHLHGGGTPTATGKNGMSIGQALAASGIPVLALDLPGHGRATRQIDGFTTFKDQIEWVLKIVDKLVDPKVKVIVSGHSWGGEFTAYWRRLSKEPKYRSRIARFITVSPPIDVSLGGDDKVNDEFDEHFERNFETLEAEAAPADFEFMKNSVRNGKTSTVGGLFTQFTFMDYKMPPLTEAQRAELLPEDAFEGESDILTWLGRSKQGLIQFGKDLTILKAGLTWKSKDATDLQKTGHNVWDLMIDGTKTLFMYDFMIKRALETAGPQGMGEDSADHATKILDTFFRQYSNFFLFRQFVSHHDEYVSTQTEERKALGKRKVELDEYLRANQERENLGRKEMDKRAVAAIESLRAELGIKDPISLVRAQEELAMPPIDEARRAELTAYLAQVDALDLDIKTNGFDDPEWNADVAAMTSKYKKALDAAGVHDLADYKAKWDVLNKQKGLSKQDMETRTQLSSLHQVYVEKFRAHQGRFGRARDLRLGQLAHPKGVPDYKAAQRELNADRSQARREALAKFVARAGEVEAAARATVAKELEAQAAAHPHPEGVTSYQSALDLKNELDSLEEFTYCPAGEPEICELGQEIKALNAERMSLLRSKDGQSIEALEGAVKKLILERSQAAKNWDGIWKKGIISSESVAAYEKQFDAKEAVYKELYLSFEDASRTWLRELKNSGRLNTENVVAMTPELKEKRAKYYAAKKEFEEFRDRGEALRWSDALSGKLTGPENAVASAVASAKKIWGTDISNPSADSLVTKIRTLEETLEQKRQQESLAAQRLSRAQWEYSQKMVEKGIKLPFTVTRIAIREALDLSYNDLVARLRTEPALMAAFRSTLEEWTSYLSTLRVESQTKDAGNY